MSRVKGLFYSSTPTSADATYQDPENIIRRGGASATRFDDHWWISRVIVSPELRGEGIGKRLLLRVLECIREQGGGRVVVCPGGYDLSYEDQKNFYESCGFKEVSEGTMEIEV